MLCFIHISVCNHLHYAWVFNKHALILCALYTITAGSPPPLFLVINAYRSQAILQLQNLNTVFYMKVTKSLVIRSCLMVYFTNMMETLTQMTLLFYKQVIQLTFSMSCCQSMFRWASALSLSHHKHAVWFLSTFRLISGCQ